MKLAFIVVFLIFLSAIEAHQYTSDVGLPVELRAIRRREDELTAATFNNETAVEVNATKSFYYPYYPQYRCELCCDGKRLNGLFPYSVSCCGKRPYDYNTALCCQDNVVLIPNKELYWQWQCCGKKSLYNVTSQICCGNKVFEKESIEQCCGSKLFNPLTSVCCKNKIRRRPSYKSWACCGTETYDLTKEKCVDGKIVAKCNQDELPYQCGSKTINFATHICCHDRAVKREDKYTLCCGCKGYQSNKDICCGGKVYPDDKSGTKSCCGTQLMDANTKICCNGVIFDMHTESDCSYSYCCGTQLLNYLSRNALCCNDNYVAIDAPYYEYYNYQCCGSKAYNYISETCCNQYKTDATVVPGQNALCCGSHPYNPSTKTCCNNTLFPLGKVPLNICCCPNNDCNDIYYPLIEKKQ